tara:strand:+ start:4252 stop:4404 length:153 start_codon:yes stop_codon:yes gene_type:complete
MPCQSLKASARGGVARHDTVHPRIKQDKAKQIIVQRLRDKLEKKKNKKLT